MMHAKTIGKSGTSQIAGEGLLFLIPISDSLLDQHPEFESKSSQELGQL